MIAFPIKTYIKSGSKKLRILQKDSIVRLDISSITSIKLVLAKLYSFPPIVVFEKTATMRRSAVVKGENNEIHYKLELSLLGWRPVVTFELRERSFHVAFFRGCRVLTRNECKIFFLGVI